MTDIVKTLRFELRDYQGGKFETAEVHCRIIDTAAYTIETLRAEVSRLTGEIEAARDAAIEEAAKVCDEWGENSPYNSRAKAIRALKGQP